MADNLKYLDSVGQWSEPKSSSGTVTVPEGGGVALPDFTNPPAGVPLPTIVAYLDDGSYNYVRLYVNKYSNDGWFVVGGDTSSPHSLRVYNSQYPFGAISSSDIALIPSQSASGSYNPGTVIPTLLDVLLGQNKLQEPDTTSVKTYGYTQASCIGLFDYGDFLSYVADVTNYPLESYTTFQIESGKKVIQDCLSALINLPNNIYNRVTVTIAGGITHENLHLFTPYFLKYCLGEFDFQTDDPNVIKILEYMKSKADTRGWLYNKFGSTTLSSSYTDGYSYTGRPGTLSFYCVLKNLEYDRESAGVAEGNNDFLRSFFNITGNSSAMSLVNGLKNFSSDFSGDMMNFLNNNCVTVLEDISLPNVTGTSFGRSHALESMKNVSLPKLLAFTTMATSTETTVSSGDSIPNGSSTLRGTEIENVDLPSLRVITDTNGGSTQLDSLISYSRYIKNLNIPTLTPSLTSGSGSLQYIDGLTCQISNSTSTGSSGTSLPRLRGSALKSIKNLKLVNPAKIESSRLNNMFDSYDQSGDWKFYKHSSRSRGSATNSYLNAFEEFSFADGCDFTTFNGSLYCMFRSCCSLKSVDFGNNTLNVTDMGDMFAGTGPLEHVNLGTLMTSSESVSMSQMFYYSDIDDLSKFEEFLAQLEKLPSNSLSYFFYSCENLTTASGFERVVNKCFNENYKGTSKLNLNYTFAACKQLTDISSLSEIDFSGVTDVSAMFSSCTSLVDVSPLSDMNLSTEVTSSTIENMFNNTTSLVDLTPLDNWDTLDWFKKLGASTVSSSVFKNKTMDGVTLPRWYVKA